MELTHLKSFAVVARHGNLSAAAKELGTTQPNLGRQMLALSKEVGLELFVRHSRGINLTADGQDFLKLCQETIGRLNQGAALIREKKSSPRGTLRIIAGTGTLETLLEHLPRLTVKYPELDFHFLSITDLFQFQIGDADVGIVPVLFSEPDIVQHHLVDGLLKVYASPSYLKNNTPLNTLEDLKDHKLIIYDIKDNEMYDNYNILPVNIDKNNKVRNHIKLNSGNAIRTALLKGLGLGTYVYTRDLVETNLLVDVFPHLPPRKVPYYLTYHKSLIGSAKIQAFHEFVRDVIKVWVPPK